MGDTDTPVLTLTLHCSFQNNLRNHPLMMSRLSVYPLLLLLIISYTMARRSPVYQANPCLRAECGTPCSTSETPDGICDGNNWGTHPELNPCSHHGCLGLRSGDECLQGDILGRCDSSGECQFIFRNNHQYLSK